MQKRNLLKNVFLCILGAFLFCFVACKSAPVSVEVRPLDILDEKSSFYIAIPKDVDSILVQSIIQNNVNGISEKNAKLICDNINTIYCGLNRSKNKTTIQASIDASIPQKYVSKVLNKKNGFTSSKFIPEKSTNEYVIYSNDALDISFPSSKIACLGRNVENMITNYDVIFSTAQSDYLSNEYSPLDSDLYDYLAGAKDEIRFYANKPQSFLTILTGTNLDLRLIDVSGSFVVDSKHDNQYLLNLHFNFKNEKFLKAGRAILMLAFGLTDSQSEINGNHFYVKGIKIQKEQLYKILVF